MRQALRRVGSVMISFAFLMWGRESPFTTGKTCKCSCLVDERVAAARCVTYACQPPPSFFERSVAARVGYSWIDGDPVSGAHTHITSKLYISTQIPFTATERVCTRTERSRARFFFFPFFTRFENANRRILINNASASHIPHPTSALVLAIIVIVVVAQYLAWIEGKIGGKGKGKDGLEEVFPQPNTHTHRFYARSLG